FPVINAQNIRIGGLSDNLGYPTESNNTLESKLKLSALPIAAYHKIYDEFYRDQNLIEPIYQEVEDGFNSYYDQQKNSLQRRAWSHDYFTSCLPFAQKGEAVTLGINGIAPVQFKRNSEPMKYVDPITGQPLVTPNINGSTALSKAPNGEVYAGNTPLGRLDNSDNLQVQLTDVEAVKINDLRRAFKLQEWLEKNARAGTRYAESLLSHFGVRSSDARLQRPEYLGGGKSHLAISEILQTSQSESTPLGTLAGHGINVGQSNNFNKRFEEHGIIIGIISILPKPSYMNTTPKMLFKFDKFDYAFPTFANLGEQEVLNREIDGNHIEPEKVFGYLPRYAEYKNTHDSVSGDFKTTLDFWHMSRKFANSPQLNKDFIECNPDNRIFAVTDETDKVWCHIRHNITARRMLPLFGTPSLL
ncbi:major capsid protein, partial [Flavobacterium sp.]|uniref:major capsid protein n=1 Tax=Flavobacterium sp. TaxID=239 RepID=UPI00375389E2